MVGRAAWGKRRRLDMTGIEQMMLDNHYPYALGLARDVGIEASIVTGVVS